MIDDFGEGGSRDYWKVNDVCDCWVCRRTMVYELVMSDVCWKLRVLVLRVTQQSQTERPASVLSSISWEG
jgi:hypothetical protein